MQHLGARLAEITALPRRVRRPDRLVSAGDVGAHLRHESAHEREEPVGVRGAVAEVPPTAAEPLAEYGEGVGLRVFERHVAEQLARARLDQHRHRDGLGLDARRRHHDEQRREPAARVVHRARETVGRELGLGRQLAPELVPEGAQQRVRLAAQGEHERALPRLRPEGGGEKLVRELIVVCARFHDGSVVRREGRPYSPSTSRTRGVFASDRPQGVVDPLADLVLVLADARALDGERGDAMHPTRALGDISCATSGARIVSGPG